MQTPPQLHFIIPDGQQESFSWHSGIYATEPIQMLNGSWALPYAVVNTPGIPQALVDSLINLNNVMELTCCDFKNCDHGG